MEAGISSDRAQPLKQEACPECGHLNPVYPGYPTWCDRCHRNAQPEPAPEPAGRIERLYLSLGKQLGSKLRDNLVQGKASLTGWSSEMAPAMIIALPVHLFTFAFLGIALILLARAAIGIVANLRAYAAFESIGGLLALTFFWFLMPSLGARPKLTFDRTELLKLFDLADRVARASNTRPVDFLSIDTIYNASWRQFGLRRRRCMILGLPLIQFLRPNELVALMAHEFAHAAIADSLSSLFIGGAIESLKR